MVLRILSAIFLSLAFLGTGYAAPAAEKQADQVEQALAHTGIKIHGQLEAPAGFQGFLGLYQGQQIPIYITPDNAHLVIGSLYDMDGNDLTMSSLQAAADARFGDEEWQQLEDSVWVAEGDDDAERIVYAFMDTECPYCHQFWEKSQAWLKQGGVQVRNVLVAVISQKSLPRAAAILEADDPTEAWRDNERNYGKERALPSKKPDAKSHKSLRENAKLMNALGFYGTPAIIYKDASGKIRSLTGLPRDDATLKTIFEG